MPLVTALAKASAPDDNPILRKIKLLSFVLLRESLPLTAHVVACCVSAPSGVLLDIQGRM